MTEAPQTPPPAAPAAAPNPGKGLGIAGMVLGIVGLVLAFKGAGWAAAILAGLSLIFGILLILNYAEPAWVLGFIWAAGVLALAGGVVEIIQAFRQRAEEA